MENLLVQKQANQAYIIIEVQTFLPKQKSLLNYKPQDSLNIIQAHNILKFDSLHKNANFMNFL